MERTYNFPVFGTQGGGLVRQVARNTYIFVEKPECPGLDIGDYMPEEWGIIAANRQATELIEEEQFGDKDDGNLFDLAMAEYTHHGPKARQL